MARPRGEQYRLWRHPENKRWYIVWEERGNTRRVSTHSGRIESAEQFKAQFLASRLNKRPSRFDISTILDAYLEQHGSKTRSPETIKFHMKALKPFFGRLRPDQITNLVISEYANSKKSLSNGTILRQLGTLKAAVRYAAGNGWCLAPAWKMPVSSPPPKDRWLTRAEAKRLLEASTHEHQRLFILLAIGTAARSGAILELKWDQIDFERGIISYGRGHGNKRRAIVPINPELKKILVKAKEISVSEYVVNWHGKKINRAYKGFKELCRKAGISEASPHTLRHTAATWMVMDGVPIEQVARFLGDSVVTVEKVYGKHSPDYLRIAANSLTLVRKR